MKTLETITSELKSYLDLPEDWDMHGGKPAQAQDVEDAINLLQKLPQNIVQEIKPMYSSTGHVGLYLNTEKVFIDLVFEGSEKFSFFSRDKLSNSEIFMDPILISNVTSQWLERYINIH